MLLKDYHKQWIDMTSNPINNYLSNRDLLLTKYLSLALALGMTVLSALGVLFSDAVYPDPRLAEAFLANDLVNLILGLPFFIYVLVLLNRDQAMGLLLLPGVLIYVIYNYFAYVVGRPLNIYTWLNLGLVLLSSYILIDFLRKVDHTAIKSGLEGAVPRKSTGWILVLIGGAFFLLACYQIIIARLTGAAPPPGERAVSLADLLVSSLWMGGGVLLLGNRAPGYTAGLGLLIAASSLFIGLILFFFVAPLLTDRPFDWIEVVTVLVMGMICFIPAFLYWRGAARSV
jgi:hypothetical protein